jgi:hypothetical protein
MSRTAQKLTRAATIVPVLVLAHMALVVSMAQPSAAAERQPMAPSSVSKGGVTLHSVNFTFPDPGRRFPGGSKADAINRNCLGCHSAGMVLTQPALSRSDWQSEVDKMRTSYKAPIDTADVPAIVNYLVALSGGR